MPFSTEYEVPEKSKLRMSRKFQNEIWMMVRYGFVGLLNTGVFSLTAYLLSRKGLHYAVYTALGYIVAIVFSFLMNTLFTFRKSESPKLGMFGRFVLVTITLLILVQGIQAGLIEIMNTKEVPAIIVGMLFYTGVGYTLNRLWVFGKQKGGPKKHCDN